MKYIIIALAFILSSTCTMAQSKKTVHKSTKKTSHVKNKTAPKDTTAGKKQLPPGTAIRGGKLVPLYHGEHDYTPGSPIGTGGAGGNTMSGSPQGSASENAIGKKASNELHKKNNGLNSKKKDSKTSKTSKTAADTLQ
jgi:hypothetical protein